MKLFTYILYYKNYGLIKKKNNHIQNMFIIRCKRCKIFITMKRLNIEFIGVKLGLSERVCEMAGVKNNVLFY